MRVKGSIRRLGTWLLVVFVMGTGAAQVLRAGSSPRSPRLAVIATPAGAGFEARIADALIPDDRAGRYRLVPIAELVEPTRRRRPLDAAGDAGDAEVDGGVESDPKEAIAEKAREAALAFDLVGAAELWRKAADDVLDSETMALDLSLAASYLIEAGAAAAAAGEVDLAHVYFRKALGIDLGVTPGPLISPDAKAVFRAAREEGPSMIEIPRDAVLEAVCKALAVDGLVWIAVGNDRRSLVISYKVFQRGGETGELETRTYRMGAGGVAPEWIEVERKRLDAAIAYKLFGRPPPPGTAVTETPPPDKPWYKKWWFYTAVGGVLIGTAAGLTSYFLLREDKADVVVHW